MRRLRWWWRRCRLAWQVVLEAPFSLARRISVPLVIEDPRDINWNKGFERVIMTINPPFTAWLCARRGRRHRHHLPFP